MKAALFILAAQTATAFPFVAEVPGVDRRMLSAGYPVQKQRRSEPCPVNPVHPGAVPINAEYPYLSALNGNRSTGKGGILVPAPGDTAHYFEAPGPLDIRGPCPGLNTMANHHFLSHDGLTTYNELIDAQQNVFNIGYGLANLLATAGVGLDGDLVTGKLSLGCSRDDYTNVAPGVAGTETGLDGHNKFEGDASLTRNDLFLANGDNYKMNATLFQRMYDTTKGNYSRDQLALYRAQRYNQSRDTNPNFFFGPGSLLMYGAATFLYGSFPSGGLKGFPDLATQKSFFGVDGEPGNFSFNNMERIPDNWFNNVQEYELNSIGGQLWSMYREYPVQFGGNVGTTDDFNAMNITGVIENGYLLDSSTPQSTMCFIYQALTAGIPSSLSNVYQIPANALGLALGKLDEGYKNLGCPSPLYPSNLPAGLGTSSSN